MVASEGVEIFGREGVAKAVSCPILSPENGFRLDGVLQNSPLIDIPNKLCNAYKASNYQVSSLRVGHTCGHHVVWKVINRLL